MKKRFLFFILVFLSFQLFAADVKYDAGTVVYVTVKSAKVGNAVVEYGDALVVENMSGKKLTVHLKDDESISGTIAVGSVTKKKISKKTDGSKIRTSSDELSLAGKGFSETAENAFKAENPDLDFSLIDKIEKITVSETDLDSFIKEGELCAE